MQPVTTIQNIPGVMPPFKRITTTVWQETEKVSIFCSLDRLIRKPKLDGDYCLQIIFASFLCAQMVTSDM